MTIIHIVDHQTDEILDFITEDLYYDDSRKLSLENNEDTLDFRTVSTEPFAEYLANRNRLVIMNKNGTLSEFIIEEVEQNSENRMIQVYSSASFSELNKGRWFQPFTSESWTAQQHITHALTGTAWEPGEIHYAGVRTITLKEYKSPLAYIRDIESRFGLEAVFRVEVENDRSRITKRYVDLVERRGAYKGYEIELGYNLENVVRIVNDDEIITAVDATAKGPTPADGSEAPTISVVVTDDDAFQRWANNGKHLWGYFTPSEGTEDEGSTTNEGWTEERLIASAREYLNNRINSAVSYATSMADLSSLIGDDVNNLELGDTVRVKDTGFNPPLYLEARIRTITGSIKHWETVKVDLGDYIVYDEFDVMSYFRQIRSELNNKVDEADVVELIEASPGTFIYQGPTPPEQLHYYWLDTSVTPSELKYFDGTKWATVNASITDINSAVDAVRQDLENQIVDLDGVITDTQTRVTTVEERMTTAETTITQTQTQITMKADKDDVYTKTETTALLGDKADKTLVETIESRVNEQGTLITQNAEAITQKASQTQVDTISTTVNGLEGSVTTIDQRLTTAEASITTQAGQISLKANAEDVYTKSQMDTTVGEISADIESLTSRMSAAELKITPDAIISTVSSTITEQVNNVQVGGRNLVLNSNVFRESVVYHVGTYFLSENWRTNHEYTISIKGSINDGQKFGIWAQGSSQNVATLEYDSAKGIYWTTFTTPSEIIGDFPDRLLIYNTPGSTNVYDATIEWVKLEHGNRPTDWTPAPEDVQGEIDGIQVGGRNLARFTNMYSYWYYYGNATYEQLTDSDGVWYARATATTTSGSFGVRQTTSAQLMKLTPGVEYTLSFKARSNVLNQAPNYIYIMNSVGANQAVTSGMKENKPLTTAWQQYEVTFTYVDRGDPENLSYVMISISNNHAIGDWIEVRDIKVEKGNRATDWTPAPEDVDASIAEKVSSDDYLIDRENTANQLTELGSAIGGKADQTALDSLSDRLDNEIISITTSYSSAIEQQADSIRQSITAIEETVTTQGVTVSNVETYMDFTEDGLAIGRSDSDLKVEIDNAEMRFMDSGTRVAYINGQKYYITNGEVTNSLVIGNHKFEKRGNSTVILWAGDM